MHYRPIVLLVLSLCATGTLSAQETSAPKRPVRFGVNLLPVIAHRELVRTEKNDITASILSGRNEIEEARFAYGANVMCAMDLSSRFAVEGGLGYSLMGYQLDMEALTYGDVIDPNRGFIYETNDVPFKAIRYSYESIEVPLRVIMRCGRGRLRSVTGVGLTTSYLLNERPAHVTVYEDGSKERTTTNSVYDYRAINLFPTLSSGAAYTLNDHFELRLEASGRYGLMGIIDAPITAHLWSAGLGCGILWTP